MARSWDIETDDGTSMTVDMPSFRQIITNPDSSDGLPVPLDKNSISLRTASGLVSLSDPDILSGERVDEEFRFKTASAQFVGVPETTPISRIVITGFVAKNPAVIELGKVVRFGPA